MSVLFVCFCNASGCVANRQTEWFWWSLRPLGAQCVAWELVFGALYCEVIGGHRTAGNSDINYLCNVFVYWLLNLRNIWSNSVSQFFFRLFSQLVLCKWAITWCPIEIIYDFCLNVSKQLHVLFFLHFFSIAWTLPKISEPSEARYYFALSTKRVTLSFHILKFSCVFHFVFLHKAFEPASSNR